MRKSRSLRTSLLLLVLVPCVALAAIWAAATSELLTEGLDLRSEAQLGRMVAASSNNLQHSLQLERRLSVAWLADPNASYDALNAQRAKTDAFLRVNLSYNLNSYPDHIRNSLKPYFDAFLRIQLPTLRSRIDQRSVSIQDAANDYSAVLQAQMTSVRNVWQLQQGALVTTAEPISMLMFTGEQMDLEDTTLAQALPSGRLTAAQRSAFVLNVGAQRQLLTDLVRREDLPDRLKMGKIVTSADWKTMTTVENDVINAAPGAHSSVALPSSALRWRFAFDGVDDKISQLIQAETADLINQQGSTADSLLWQQGLASIAGLAALIASALLSWRISRSLLRRMSGLRESTLELAESRLPDVVARLNRGERVDVETAAPPLDYGADELGQVAQAFNAAQRTGISSAVALAESRNGFQRVILGVARHTQNLVNRQLSLLDELERQHQESDVLDGLYQLDSQATQMRRYEENLVIIAGGQPGRRWSEPVDVADVLRSATGEVAEFQRITVQADDEVWIVGYVVGDIIHLLAELMENATSYSPTICPVWVRADLVGRGLAVEIEDRGMGMSAEDYAAINRRLSEPPEFDVLGLAEDPRLGTFVVARLATQHGISVTLRPSPYGGTSVVVLIPEKLVVRNTSENHFGSQALMTDSETPMPDAMEPDIPSTRRSFSPAPAAFSPAASEPPVQPPAAVAAAASASAPATAQPMASVTVLARASSGSATASSGQGRPASLPTLPQRVPQASLVDELKSEPASEPVLEESQPHSPARPAASAIASFQRGTKYARHARPSPNGTPYRTTPTAADASKEDAPR